MGIILGGLVGGAALAGTVGGLGIGQRDAPSYLSSAENLGAGLGYRTSYGDPGKAIDFDETTSPVIDFPPGYPAVLSVGVILGADSDSAARVVGAILVFSITVGVYLGARALPAFRSGIGAALVALIAGALTLPYTTTALTEPLYGLLLILTLTAAGIYVRTARPVALIAATILAAAATTVRTGGLALVATVVLVSWLVLQGRRERWIVPVVVGMVGVSPFFLSTGVGNRVLGWHPPDLDSIQIFANAVAEWFVPPIGTPTLRVAILLVLLTALLAWARPWSQRGGKIESGVSRLPVWSVGLIAAVAHVALVVVSKAFLSYQLSLGSRQLYPVGLSLLFAAIQYLGNRSNERGEQRISQAFFVLGVSCLLATGWVAVTALLAVGTGERGFNSEDFLESDAVEYLMDSVPGDHVFANVPDGLWVAGLADARPIPTVYDPLSLSVNEMRDQEMSRLADSIEGGAVVFYYLDHERDYMVDESELRAIAPCVVVADGDSVVLSGADHAVCSGR